ncbi:VOC family protein [Paenibacillus sp. FSL H7-0350]|uniref:VOC family protein n=1 Tax=Paenibacillus sp. FSL H7-0350 TaxID=2975345 RepID=UPI0031584831
MKVHHLGFIVKDMKKDRRIFEALGFVEIGDVVYDFIQDNNIMFLESQDGSLLIELIEAVSERSSVRNFKSGYHHICFEGGTKMDMNEWFKSLKIGKIFTRQFTAPALQSRKVVFACLNNGSFIEFIL